MLNNADASLLCGLASSAKPIGLQQVNCIQRDSLLPTP